MYSVFGLYKPSLALELGIKKLEERGLAGDRLLVVTLDACEPGKQRLLDSMDSTDGMSLLDGMAISASIGMLLGVIYGTLIYIGPVALGLIGLVAGGGLGYLLDNRVGSSKKNRDDYSPGEIMVAVKCLDEGEASEAEKIMKDSRAVALGRKQY